MYTFDKMHRFVFSSEYNHCFHEMLMVVPYKFRRPISRTHWTVENEIRRCISCLDQYHSQMIEMGPEKASLS